MSPDPLQITNIYQLLALIVVMLPGILAAIISYRNSNKLDVARGKLDETKAKIDQNTETMNGHLSTVVEAVKTVALIKGEEIGLAKAKAIHDAEKEKNGG